MRMTELEQMEEDGSINKYPKKEVIQLRKEREKLEKYLSGIKDMRDVPDALFVIDPRRETIAVLEARKLGIPSSPSSIRTATPTSSTTRYRATTTPSAR